jgi:Metallo-beta-lactamase superfamily
MGLIPDSPAPNEIEVSVFGPGFGECSVVHIGDGRWIIVDSCIDAISKEPAALKYLRSIGADANCVDLIVATHWHDDHVRGLSQLIEAYPQAQVCVSPVLTSQEFVTSIIAHDERPLTRVTSGVHEMKRVIDLQQGKGITRAFADRRIFQQSRFSHGNAVEIWTLSPGDVAYDRFIQSLGKLMPRVGEQKRRVPVLTPNECSVVVLVMIGPLAILLGADLEENSSCKGWSAIIDSRGRPNCRADFFKVPHHGSVNAYHPDVWRHMLTSNPVCAWHRTIGGVNCPVQAT